LDAISKLFIDNKGKLEQAFSKYSVRFEEMLTFKSSVVLSNHRLVKFVLLHESVLGKPLESFQIEPVQRVMRYGLLLKSLFKKEQDDLNVIECVEKVCQAINQKVSERAGQRMTYILQENLFKGKVTLFSKSAKRRCIRVGVLEKKFNSSNILRSSKTKFYFFMLFDDSLGYADLAKDGKSAKLKYLLPLGGMKARVDDEKAPLSCTIVNSCKKITVKGKSAEEVQEWVEDITKAVAALEDKYQKSNGLLPVGNQLTKTALVQATEIFQDDFIIFDSETPWLSSTI
jgi:hypothetical protein